MAFFSGVTFVSFCFDFVSMLSLKPRSFVQSAPICRRPDSQTCFFLFFFVYVGDVAFFEYFCTISAFSLYGEYVVRSFFPNDVFLPCDHGLDF